MKKILPFILFLLLRVNTLAQTDISREILVLGNIADVEKYDDFLFHFESRLKEFETDFLITLNGDIVSNNDEKEDPLFLVKRILDLTQNYPLGRLVILSGDRDWNNSGKGGLKKVLNLEKEILAYKKENGYKRIKWITPEGCPGPFIEEVDESFVFIAINTQWWNHPFDKPRPSDGDCKIITHRDFMEELEDAVDDHNDKNVLIVGHHPFKSLGNYGGYFSFGNRMKPLPIYGSFRIAYHRKVGSTMDITNENLEPFVEGMKNLFFFNKNLIFVSSHEHNQQIILDNENFIINAGAIENGKYAGKDPNAWLSSAKAGWIELCYKTNGAVEAKFVSLNGKSENNQSYQLFDSACSTASMGPNENTPTNLAYAPCFKNKELPSQMARNYPAFENVVAGPEYKASKWKQFWWGKHYRTTWTEPVKSPYLNLDTTFNGLKIFKKGGGRQTTSLKFRAANKTVYVFRSVNKDPSKAFNYRLRPTLVSTVTKDQTSTQHPYGAMAVAPLLDKVDILHANPVLYLLPDDEKLGHFQFKYGNLFGMLEQHPGKKNVEGKRFGNADKIVRSNKLFRELYNDQRSKVDLNEFVRARNFDILVGDWSKHEDNWKWAKYKGKEGNIFRPIPRDRDHVFSKQDGFWPWLADREWGLQNIENFDYKIKGLKSLMWQARHMDRFLAAEATREMWINEAKNIQNSINDADIEAAIKNMPAEIYKISGETVEKKLKKRIKDLPKYAEEYYELLAHQVEILGSTEKEYFEIIRNKDGTVTVAAFNQAKGKKKGKIQLYFRTFYPKETKEIRIFGLGGGDVFDLQGEGTRKIKIRVLGGSGDDLFKENGSVKPSKTLIYDKGKGTKIELGKGAKIAKEWNKDIYEYDRTRFKYNTYLPLLYLNYSNFNGFTLAAGIRGKTHKYNKEDYAIKYNLAGGISTKGNIKIAFETRFHHVFKKWDFLIDAFWANPEFHNNFFGLGNSTTKSKDLENVNFYEIEYSKTGLRFGTAREFWRNSEFKFTIGSEVIESKKLDQNTILDDSPQPLGTYQRIVFFPIKARLNLDFRDEKGFPYNGTHLFLNYSNEPYLIDGSNSSELSNFGVLDGAIEYYISTVNKKRVTLGMRFGGAYGHGDIPFYKMPYLGGDNGLRGFTGQRFTGNSKIYFNSELRWQLLDKYTPLFPIKFGIKGFFDTGRVYYNSDESSIWHLAYGAGIFVVPFEEAFIISVSLGFSDEESFYPIIGLGTPLR